MRVAIYAGFLHLSMGTAYYHLSARPYSLLQVAEGRRHVLDCDVLWAMHPDCIIGSLHWQRYIIHPHHIANDYMPDPLVI